VEARQFLKEYPHIVLKWKSGSPMQRMLVREFGQVEKRDE